MEPRIRRSELSQEILPDEMKVPTSPSTTRNVKLQPSQVASKLTCQRFLTSRLRLKEEFPESQTDSCKYSRKMELHMPTCGAMPKESGTKSEKFKGKEEVLLNSQVKSLQEPPTTLVTTFSQPENTTK